MKVKLEILCNLISN